MLNDSHNPPGPSHEAPSARQRILVVEDDFLIRMMLVEVLADDGFDVVEAETGDEALPLLDASIALLVTDVHLPGALDGRALASTARQTRPDLPVIYTSGGAAEKPPAGSRDLAVPKPYQGSEICAAIRLMLKA
jgi:DNA-binding response OmpR family regulator